MDHALRNPVLVILEMQNDAIGAEGAFADSGVPEHAESQQLVQNVTRLADAAREARVPVIHVWYVVDPGASGFAENAPLFAGVRGAGALVRGSIGAAPVDGLEPRPGDHVVEKTRVNGFFGTRLRAILTSVNAQTLVITGAWTNLSVEHTARHAADDGYSVVVVSDGTATTGDAWQQAAMTGPLTLIAKCVTTDELLPALTARRTDGE